MKFIEERKIAKGRIDVSDEILTHPDGFKPPLNMRLPTLHQLCAYVNMDFPEVAYVVCDLYDLFKDDCVSNTQGEFVSDYVDVHGLSGALELSFNSRAKKAFDKGEWYGVIEVDLDNDIPHWSAYECVFVSYEYADAYAYTAAFEVS